MSQPETIPFYLSDDFVARLAFSLWSVRPVRRH
jgi:hypothetical protein